jgi:hypothetical protein
MDLIAEQAKPIPLEQAKAREKLWTPEKDDEGSSAAKPGGLWTPDRQPSAGIKPAKRN